MEWERKMKIELFDLYYSNSQAKVMHLNDCIINTFIDENGNSKQYTEAVRHGKKPSGLG